MRLRRLPRRLSVINKCIKWIAELMRTLFLMLLIVYLLLFLVEAVFEGSVSSHLNLRYLLIVVIVVGVIMVLAAPGKTVGYLRQIVEFARATPPLLKRFFGVIRYSRWAVAVAQQVFVMLLITFMLLLVVETIWKGSVSSYLNLNYLLIAVIAVGVVAILSRPGRVQEVQDMERRHLGRRDIVIVVCAALAGATAVWYKTREIGWLSYLISAVSGGLIALLSILIWQGNEGEENEGQNS